MQSLMEEMREPVLDFIEKETCTLHLVTGPQWEQGCLLKLIKDMHQAAQQDYYLMAVEPFSNPDDYLDHLVGRINDEYRDYLLMQDLKEKLDALEPPAETPSPLLMPEDMPNGPKIPLGPTSSSKSKVKKRLPILPEPAGDTVPLELEKETRHRGPKLNIGIEAPAMTALPEEEEENEETEETGALDWAAGAATESVTANLAETTSAPTKPNVAESLAGLSKAEKLKRVEEMLAETLPKCVLDAMDNPSQEPTAELLKRLQPAISPPPPHLLDRTMPAPQRLNAIFDYGLSCLPNQTNHRFVFVLLPAQNNNVTGWHELLEHTAANPNYHTASGLRFIASYVPEEDRRRRAAEEQQNQVVRPLLPEYSHVQHQALDLGPAQRKAAEEAFIADPETPVHDRMVTLISAAVRDGVEGRTELAHARFQEAHDYFAAKDEKTPAAFALIGRGDIHLRNHDWNAAIEIYRQALPHAVSCENPIMLFQLSKNYGEAAFRLKEWLEAAQAFCTAAHAAEMITQQDAQINALERHASACFKLQAWDHAAESLEKAAHLCQTHHIDEPVDRILRFLRKVYAKQNRKAEWTHFRDQMQSLSKGA